MRLHLNGRLSFALILAAALASASCGRAESRPSVALKSEKSVAAESRADVVSADVVSADVVSADGMNAYGAPTAAIDMDGDGLPDRAELRSSPDRASFRRWFTSIAELQFYESHREWNREQRDCAGLVRFALREALRRHDRAWHQRMGAGYEHIAGDLRAYTLERSPVGEKLFRTAPGSFKESDLSDGTLSEFADARTLKDFNSRFISRDPAAALPGDLLFFHQPGADYPYHVMIFLGRARLDDEGAADWVVYHTGASSSDDGEVRKVRLAVLARHPAVRWRPLVANRNFLGFYRLNILQ